MIFKWKGKIDAESESYERVSNVDFYPTIKKLVDYSKPVDFDGEDLTPIFDNKKLRDKFNNSISGFASEEK